MKFQLLLFSLLAPALLSDLLAINTPLRSMFLTPGLVPPFI
ncbi:hypothetical protein [Chitinophaga sp. CF418]|nr:hypothetical protein [Chitinophaga sp. CF418]